ncbi:flagellin [Brevundimonas sp. MF30-B]|nr:flagellin [Brevundimonas sp. MF30-B]QBX38595.1 flagellin [Brevundimonas sp. MF30-B]
MASINTNYGAMVAAQSLAATGRELANVQNRVTTGMKVSSAKDNGAVWAIATTQKANAKALDATINNLQRSQSINDVGLAAGETIMAALTEMKALGTAIEAATAAGSSTTAYVADFTALSGEITAAIAAANFDGVAAFGASPPAVPAAQTAAGVQTSIDAWASALQGLGTTSKSLERQITFNTKLQDALEAGAGNLVDADLAKESARLTALQTKQQLGVQALAIANSSSSILLGLFR